MEVVTNRFDVYLVNLDPVVGAEIQKTRPCAIISPDEMNHHLRTVIVAPMTTKGRPYPSRVPCRFEGKDGQVVLDQVRTVDKARLVRDSPIEQSDAGGDPGDTCRDVCRMRKLRANQVGTD